MSFDFNIIDYVITRKRLNVVKTQNIIDRIQDVLDYIREKLNNTQLIMIEQINRYKKLLRLKKTTSFFLTLKTSLSINYVKS